MRQQGKGGAEAAASRMIRRFDADPNPQHILYAFSSAAAGTADWERVAQVMGAGVSLRAVRLPGRESRFAERALASVTLQVEDALQAARRDIGEGGKPYSIVGMCSGAIVGFELALALETVGDMPGPESLIAIGQVSPARFEAQAQEDFGHSSDDAAKRRWLEEVAGWKNEMISAEVLEAFGPTIDADLAALSSYRYKGGVLSANVVVIVGRDETAFPSEWVMQWSQFTKGTFKLLDIDGDRPILSGAQGDRTARALKSALSGSHASVGAGGEVCI